MTKKITRSKEVKSVGESEITQEIEEERGSWIDAVSSYAPIGAVIVGLITALVAIYNYKLQSSKEISTREGELKKPFLEKQADFYFEAVEVVSKIATTIPNPSKDDVDHFCKLYWGRLATVVDR